MIGDYEGLQDVTTRFQVLHVAMVLTFCLLAVAMHTLLDGLRSRAAAVARLALYPFVAFYAPYLAFEGFALGVLGQELGEPGVFWLLGTISWLTVIVATVLAFRRAGAPLKLQVLLGASALIAGHTPPLAPIGLVCFAAAGWMVLRRRRCAMLLES